MKMPHLIVEHSSNLDVSDLLTELNETLTQVIGVDPNSVKARSLSFKDHLIAGKPGKAFISTTVRLMAGRDKSLLKKLLESLQQKLQSYANTQSTSVAISTHLMELEQSLYQTQNIDD